MPKKLFLYSTDVNLFMQKMQQAHSKNSISGKKTSSPGSGSRDVTEINKKEHEPSIHPHFILEGLPSLQI